VAALAGGAAHVTVHRLFRARHQAGQANDRPRGFDATRTTMLDADVNAMLRQYVRTAYSMPSMLDRRCTHGLPRRGGLHALGHQPGAGILAPDLACCSPCSGGVNADLFHKIVASAGIDAGVDALPSRAHGRRGPP
jgi:23S rRNA (cytosine1962-C5)-methyltransferase